MTAQELIEVFEAAGKSGVWDALVARAFLSNLLGVPFVALLSFFGCGCLHNSRKMKKAGEPDWEGIAAVGAGLLVLASALFCLVFPNLLYPEAAALKSLLN